MKKMAYIVTLALFSTLSTALFAQEVSAPQPPETPQVEHHMNGEKPMPPPDGKRKNRNNNKSKGEMKDGKRMPPPAGMERQQRGNKGDKMVHPRPPRMNKKMRELVEKAKAGDATAKEELKKCVDANFAKRIQSAEKQLKKQETELAKVKNHIKEISESRETKVNEITEKMLVE